MTCPFCPRCGYDLALDQPIILQDFAMLGPHAHLRYKGELIRMTPAERSLCWTLMKAYPRAVRRDVILDRMGSEGVGNLLDVYMSRMRKKLRAIGAPIPFEPVKMADQKAVIWTLSGPTPAASPTACSS